MFAALLSLCVLAIQSDVPDPVAQQRKAEIAIADLGLSVSADDLIGLSRDGHGVKMSTLPMALRREIIDAVGFAMPASTAEDRDALVFCPMTPQLVIHDPSTKESYGPWLSRMSTADPRPKEIIESSTEQDLNFQLSTTSENLIARSRNGGRGLVNRLYLNGLLPEGLSPIDFRTGDRKVSGYGPAQQRWFAEVIEKDSDPSRGLALQRLLLDSNRFERCTLSFMIGCNLIVRTATFSYSRGASVQN